MGVPHFVGQIIKGITRIRKYHHIMTNKKILSYDTITGNKIDYYQKIYNGIVSSFSIDLNALIHYVAGNVYGYVKMKVDPENVPKQLTKKQQKEKLEECKQILWQNILLLYNVTRPKDIFILAADGIAAAGKIIQQRRRRFSKNPYFNPIFDSNSISPGTEFMIEIDKFLRKMFTENKSYFGCEILYSSHMAPGEGEHKIFEYFRTDRVPKRKGEVHIVHGLDADLIMLSLLSPCNNIVLMRENNDPKHETVRELQDDKVYTNLLEIETFKDFIQDKKIPIKDYVFMAMLLGNDFIPHQVSLKDIGESIDLMMYIHNQFHLTLIQSDNKINFKGFRKLLEELYKKEPKSITYRINDKNPIKLISSSMEYNQEERTNKLNYAKFRKLWYERALSTSLMHSDRALASILGEYGYKITNNIFDVKKVDIDHISHSYLSILNWTFIYYNEGYKKVDDSISYNYDFAPLFIDLLNSTTKLINAGITEIEGLRSDHLDDNFTVLHQLISVLPISSVNILPEPLKVLFTVDSSIIDLFPLEWDEILEGSDKSHLAIHRIPIPTRDRISKAFEDIIFDPKFLLKYVPQTDLFIEK